MAIDFSGVRYIQNGEPVDKSVLNRPVEDLASILEDSVFDSLLDSARISIASASNINLSTGAAANTRHLNITGTTAITGFTVPVGKTYLVRFAAVTTLTNNSAIVTQTGANITTAAGDTCWIRSTANNVVEVTNYKHGVLPVAQGGTGTATSTGSGSVVLSASPVLTGNPTVPTQSETDNSQRAASTAFVQSQKVSSSSDATAGKTLTVGYMGLGSNTAPIENADCDNLTRAGFYTIGTTAANRPSYMTSVGSGLLVLSGGASTRCSQMHFADNSSSVRVSVRHLTSSGWSAWVELTHSGNFTPSDYLGVTATAAAATKLATARTIGGVSFDGTANINLPGVNQAGNQNTSGNAATATKLATARTINGVAFDGTANITVADTTKEPAFAAGTTAQYRRGDKSWQDFATAVRAAVLTGLSTATSTAVAATDSVLAAIGKLQAQVTALGTSKLDASANAVSATKLATARNINGVPFDGTANITVVDDTKLPLAGGSLSGELRVAPGTVSVPGVSFSNDTDTGLYRVGTNALGVSTGGTPAASFLSDGSMDVYGRLRSIGNTATTSWTSRGCSFATEAAVHTDTSSASSSTVSSRAANSFAAPTFASTNPITVSTAINLYVNGAPIAGTNTSITDSWALWVNGKSRMSELLVSGTTTAGTFNATSLTDGGFQGIDTDTAASPSFTWSGDLDTGMYLVGTNSIGFATGGVNRVTINSSGISGAGAGLTGLNAANISTGTLAVARGGTGVTTSTGSGSVVLSASPALSGTPTAPTAATGTNTTQLATTAFVSNTIAANTTASITGNGWQRLPSGLIIQWGSGIADSSGKITGSWPTTFPNAVLQAIANSGGGATGTSSVRPACIGNGANNSTYTFWQDSAVAGNLINYIAIGF
jgi:hypothetical protein